MWDECPAAPAVQSTPILSCTRAEATTDFPTALAGDALTAYRCEHLHNDEIFGVGAALSHLGTKDLGPRTTAWSIIVLRVD
jgi:hypothetical protein